MDLGRGVFDSRAEPDIIGRSYEYLIRSSEGSVSSAGEFYTPKEVGMVMARILDPEPGMTVYDPCCGSAGLLIKYQLVLEEKMILRSRKNYAPLQLYGQEYTPETWAMANMNMIIHDMQGQIEIGDSFKNPKFRKGNLRPGIANPMWNQDCWKETDYDNDELDRFPKGAAFPGRKADWAGRRSCSRRWTNLAAPPSSSTPALPPAAPATPTPTKKKTCANGSSSKT